MSSQFQLVQRSKQQDTDKILVEIQLKLIYYVETILTFLKGQAIALTHECANTFNAYFADSFLYSLFFKCKTYFLNNTIRRKRLMDWLQDKLKPPFTPTNFSSDWRDGIRLCALCEAISPGACPRYDLLSQSNAQNNIKLALNLIQAYLNVKPSITVREIYESSSEANLVHLLSQIKIAYGKRAIKNTGVSWLKLKQNQSANVDVKSMYPSSSMEFFFNRCFVKGMGLISAVRSRRARFSIYYYETLPKISLIFEIIGPNESFCSEKVVAEFSSTDTDDEEKENVKQIMNKSYDQAQSLIIRAATQKRATDKNLKIPFFYKIFADHILITYIPLFVGEHIISIIWQGQLILNSPYRVSVEESGYLESHVRDIGPKFEPGFQYPLCLLKSHKNTSMEEMGTVVRAKVLRKSIIANGKEYEYKNYFETSFNPNFLKYPNDPHVLEYRPRKTRQLSVSGEANYSFAKEKGSSRKGSTASTQSNNKKITAEKIHPLEEIKNSKSNSFQNERTTTTTNEYNPRSIPEIRIDSVDDSEPASPCRTTSPSLKEIVDDNSKHFNENMEKLKKSLEENLNKYKAQLDSQ